MQHEYTDILKVFEGLRCPELNNESIHFSVLLNKKKAQFYIPDWNTALDSWSHPCNPEH